MFDRNDFDETLEEKQKEKVEANRDHLTMLSQAVVKSELLTGNENWDYFLTLLQSAVEAEEGILSSLKEKLCDPNLVDHEDVLRVRFAIFIAKSRIETYKAVMNLPKEMKEKGQKAKLLLE